jgi:hypothetical protein
MIFSKNKKAPTNNEPALNLTFKNSLLEKVNECLIFNSNGKASQNLTQDNVGAQMVFQKLNQVISRK